MFTTSDQNKTCISVHMKAFAQCKTNTSGFVYLFVWGLVVGFFFLF